MVYRCYYCHSVVLESDIEAGGCPECSAMRVRIAVKLTDAEMENAKARGFEFKPEEWSSTKVLGRPDGPTLE